MKTAKIEKFKCGILSNFQTMWNTFWFCDHSKTKILIFCDNLLITRNFFLRLMTPRGFHEFSQRIKQSSSKVLLQYLHNNHSVWKSPKMSHLNFWRFPTIFVLLSTQVVNVARFARNVECDFFCDFQTLWATPTTLNNLRWCSTIEELNLLLDLNRPFPDS